MDRKKQYEALRKRQQGVMKDLEALQEANKKVGGPGQPTEMTVKVDGKDQKLNRQKIRGLLKEKGNYNQTLGGMMRPLQSDAGVRGRRGRRLVERMTKDKGKDKGKRGRGKSR